MRRFLIPILSITLLVLTRSASFAQQTQVSTQLDSIFGDWSLTSPGGAVCVVDHGSVIYRKAFGMADLERKIPNTPEHQFELASMAKQFTAMCIALLEEQGKLSPEDDIKKYYADFQFKENIKIRNLIDHTSGIREAYVLTLLSGKMNLKGEVRRKYNTKPYLLSSLNRETDLNFTPGSELAYTNVNYILLGDIVEKVSRQSLQKFADSAIFKPLGMTHTLFRDGRDMKIPGEANGYLLKKGGFKSRKAYGGVVGDHNLVSTVDDLVKWQLNFFNNKLGKGDQRLMEKVNTGSTLNNGAPTYYGYGQWIGEHKGLKHIQHGGDDGRHTTMMSRFPDQQLVVIVLANSSRYSDMERKTYQVGDKLLKHFLTEPEVKEPIDRFTFITLPEEALAALAGLYTRTDDRGLANIMKVTYIKPDLYASAYYNWEGLKLAPVRPDYFVTIEPDGKIFGVTFSQDPSGYFAAVTHPDLKPRRFKLLREIAAPYADFKGKFLNKSTGASIKVRAKKNKIVAHKGIIKIPLIMFGKDQFYAPDNDALFIFQRDQKERVSRLQVNAPDFRNFFFEKQ